MSKTADQTKGGEGRKRTVWIILGILLTAAVITWVIYQTEPRAKRSGAVKKTAMLVDVVKPEYGNFSPVISSTAVVKPSRRVKLAPLVSGTVIHMSGNFVPGGFVRKNEVLLKIDPADYRNILAQKKSDLSQAQAELEIELGRQKVARKDYQILAESLTDDQEALILRKPQLNSARARVKAAESAVNQAELDLLRTVIRAPFDSHILSRDVNLGSRVSRNELLGDIVGIDTYWVEATVPVSKLRWLKFPGTSVNTGSGVTIRHRTAWRENESREGNLFRLIGSLDPGTRLARVLITVKDPLSRHRASSTPDLIIGSFVEARIQGEVIPDVVRLKREYIRKGETVWVYADRELKIRQVTILLKDETHAYIASGVMRDDLVVTTNLSTVVEGARLRLESEGIPQADLPSAGVQQLKDKASSGGEKR